MTTGTTEAPPAREAMAATVFAVHQITDPFTATVLSPTQLFLARGLTFGDTAHEGTELIRRFEAKIKTTIDRVWSAA